MGKRAKLFVLRWWWWRGGRCDRRGTGRASCALLGIYEKKKDDDENVTVVTRFSFRNCYEGIGIYEGVGVVQTHE